MKKKYVDNKLIIWSGTRENERKYVIAFALIECWKKNNFNCTAKFGGHFVLALRSHFPLLCASLPIFFSTMIIILLKYVLYLFALVSCDGMSIWLPSIVCMHSAVETRSQRDRLNRERKKERGKNVETQEENLWIKTDYCRMRVINLKWTLKAKNNKYRTYYKYLMENNCSKCIFIMRMCVCMRSIWSWR